MPPEDTPEVVLVRLDGRLSVLEEGVRELRKDVREMHQETRGTLAALQFVRQDVYASEQKTAQDYAAETRKIAENARMVAWAVASLVIAGFGLMLALIKAVAA